MSALGKLARIGAALDSVGRAAAPTAAAPRFDRAPSVAQFSSNYGEPSGLDLLGAETLEEAMVDRDRAIEWRQEAAVLGQVAGIAAGMALGAYLTRGRR